MSFKTTLKAHEMAHNPKFKGSNYNLITNLTEFKVVILLRKTNIERQTPQSEISVWLRDNTVIPQYVVALSTKRVITKFILVKSLNRT